MRKTLEKTHAMIEKNEVSQSQAIKWITVGDDSAGLGRHFEFFSCEFENGSKRGSLWDAEPEIEKTRMLRLISWQKLIAIWRSEIKATTRRERIGKRRTLWRVTWDRRWGWLWRRPYHHPPFFRFLLRAFFAFSAPAITLWIYVVFAYL